MGIVCDTLWWERNVDGEVGERRCSYDGGEGCSGVESPCVEARSKEW